MVPYYFLLVSCIFLRNCVLFTEILIMNANIYKALYRHTVYICVCVYTHIHTHTHIYSFQSYINPIGWHFYYSHFPDRKFRNRDVNNQPLNHTTSSKEHSQNLNICYLVTTMLLNRAVWKGRLEIKVQVCVVMLIQLVNMRESQKN